MFDFKEIKDGSINIVGLNSELECIYIDDLYKKNNSNILVVVNSIYEANKLYNSLVNYNHDAYLFLMDDFVTSEASISSPEMEITRLETLNSIVFNNEIYKIEKGKRYESMSKIVPYCKLQGMSLDETVNTIFDNNIDSKDLLKWSREKLKKN